MSDMEKWTSSST